MNDLEPQHTVHASNSMPNPLTVLDGLPPFSAIRPEHIEPAIDAILTENRALLNRLLSAPPAATWDAVVAPVEDMGERLSRAWSPVSHLNAVVNNDALRAAYNACLPKLSAYWTELAQDERLYAAYKAVAASAAFAQLSQPQQKIVQNALRDFRLGGAELPADKKARFKAVQQELSTLTAKFEENLLDATNAWDFWVEDEARLAGLPENARAQAREAARAVGREGWRFTLHAPSYIPVMSYADDGTLRETLYRAYVTRASEAGPRAGKFDNSELMVRILALRDEAARLLGYRNYAERSLVTKMARSVEQVLGFLRDLAARSKPVAERELAELREFARTQFGVRKLEAWDIPYYAEKLRQARYAFSEEDLRPYFPEPQVVQGMFDVVRRLYGLRIEPRAGVDVWHPDVRFYEIFDERGALRGQFYMDLYARAHKRGGAWMDECIVRKRTASGVQVPVAYLTCNFSGPVEGKPALFTHDEVQTLFHEFGHGLHHMLTQIDYPGVAGINGVAWDAVELPSQFMENWCWEREALDLFACHYETGAKIPDDLYAKMQAAKNFHSALQMLRQVEFAVFDMRLHAEAPPRDAAAIQALLNEVRREVAVIQPPDFNRFQHSFSHIFAGGYAAGYYSYKWAEVLSADAFSKFEENGIFDRRTGLEFLHHILEQGGAREPMELFVAFRGREPRIDALLRHSGLAA